jgi:hypothetical protein
MKTTTILFIITLFLCSTFAACKKDKNAANDNQLPPATQTGANTFGCLVNDKLFVPKGYTNPYPNYRIFVDPGANNDLEIKTYSYSNNIETDIGFTAFGVNGPNNYVVQNGGLIYPYYRQNTNSDICNFTSTTSNFKSGYLKITRYDLPARIISGEFEFKLYDSTISCDTIRITQGRFDKKF